jgi:hypothetical protein
VPPLFHSLERLMRITTLRALCFTFPLLALAAAAPTAQPAARLWAPTYYIAATATTNGPDKIDLNGASNLPSGSRLRIFVSPYIGQNSKILNQDEIATVENGFFQMVLRPKDGSHFSHNVVCDIVFGVDGQSAAVLRIVGRRGEHLGFPANPQAEVTSGNYVLDDMVHVP